MSPEMNNKEHNEILDSLQGMKRAAAPEFFYTRLRARMDQELDAAPLGWIGKLLTRPSLSLGLAGIILLLNITTIMKMVQQPGRSSAPETSAPFVVADYSSIYTYPVYDETPDVP